MLTTTHALTPDRLILDLAGVSSPVISGDGTRIAYSLGRIDRGTAAPSSQLWVMDADGANARQMTQVGTTASDLAWSPNDREIAFVSKREGGFAICVLALEGGEARVVTSHQQKPASLVWSPDGTAIAYTVPVDPTNPDEAPRDADLPPPVRVTRRIDYKQDGRGYLDDVRHQVMTVDVATAKRAQVSSGLHDHDFPQWSPDGATIAAKVSTHNGMRSTLALLPVEGGEPRTVGFEGGAIGTWAWSPDGASILLDGYPNESPQTEYYLCDVASGELRQITDDLDLNPEAGYPTLSGPAQPVWLDDATALITGSQAGGTGLWRLDLATGKRTCVAFADASRSGLSVDRDHSRCVQASSDPDGPGKLVATDLATGELTILLDPNADFFTATPPATVEKVTIDRDGWKIDAWVTLPADLDESASYPLVLDIHGGPHGAHGFSFNIPAQVLASHGIVVVSPNPRGSSAYGREFAEAVWEDWGGEDWRDLQAVVDHVASRPYIDADRLGVYGYSYGGYMTSWAIGQTDRFKAAVCGAPAFNLVSMYGTSDISHGFGELQWGGPLADADVAAWMRERSPSTHIHKAVTPTLILHGEADDRCPVGQGEEMFVGLLKAGVETEFVRYPEGSHLMILNGSAQHRIDFYTRILTWMERYLKA